MFVQTLTDIARFMAHLFPLLALGAVVYLVPALLRMKADHYFGGMDQVLRRETSAWSSDTTSNFLDN